MITKRTTEETWVASIYDPAVMRSKGARKYMTTRRLSDAGIDKNGLVDGTGELATLFRVKPLTQKLVHLKDGADGNSIYQRMIFKSCVTDIKNFGDVPLTRDDEDNSLSDSTIDLIGLDIVMDIALYCVDQVRGKNGNTNPFSSRDGWQTEETRQRAFDATYATIGTKSASEKDTSTTE